MSLLLQGLEVGFGVGTLKLKSLILIRVTIGSKIKEIKLYASMAVLVLIVKHIVNYMHARLN